MNRVVVVLCGVLLPFAAFVNAINIPSAYATAVDPGWASGDVKYEALGANSPYPKRCVTEYRKISPIMGHIYTSLDQTPDIQVCVYKNKSFQYAEYQRDYYIYPTWPSFGTVTESGVAFGDIAGDTLIPSDVISAQVDLGRLYTGEGSDIYLYQTREANYALSLAVMERPLLHDVVDSNGILHLAGEHNYKLRSISERGDYADVSALGGSVSENGRYAVFAGENIGFFILDLDQHKGVLLNNSFRTTQDISPKPAPTLAISNDGKYVVAGGWNVDTLVYSDINAGCGVEFHDEINLGDLRYMHVCDSRDLTSFTSRYAPSQPSGYHSLIDVHMSARGDSFTYFDAEKWATIYAPNYLPPDSMDYIALGDSYTSGEGDYYHPEGSHYLPLTNILGNYKVGTPRELCHLSDRSYPFLLAKDMGVSRGADMQSVACSGAVRSDILSTNIAGGIYLNYLGQSTPLSDRSTAPRLQLLKNPQVYQAEARANFIPGRVQQVEFIKQHHPKVATVGVSGNDVGFASVLTACLLNNPLETCDYARPSGLQDMANILQGNYDRQLEFYTQLKKASPGTDFYAVGYPQFISDDQLVCWSLGGSLNQQERALITKSVTYLNATIRNAASTAGIKYINIEHALDGKQMCGQGSGAVSHPLNKVIYGAITGDLLGFEDKDVIDSKSPVEDYLYQQLSATYRNSAESLSNNPMTAALLVATETFHPNAIGHQLIYEYIHNHQNGTSLLDDGCDGTVIICPSDLGAHDPPVPAEFGTVKSLKTEVASIILRQSDDGTYTEPGIGGVVERGARVYVRPMALESAGLVAGAKVTLHYDPVMLGSVLVQNGSIASTELQIPEYASIGFHTISLDIALADGGSLKYVQPIFITGPADDIDGDGVANKVDTCEFLAPSGTDLDSDGIDDVCDILWHEQAGPIGDLQYSTRATVAQPPVLTAGSASIFHKPYTPNHTALNIVPHAAATVALPDANNHMSESDNDLLLITVSVLAFLLTVYLLLHNR